MKHVGARPDGRCDMRPPVQLQKNVTNSQNRSISAGEIYSTICVEWAVDHFGVLVWRKSIHFWNAICGKRFLHFCSHELDLWSLDFKFAPLVTLVQRYVSCKLEVSMAFLFREYRRHGTDGRTDGHASTLNAAPKEGHITNRLAYTLVYSSQACTTLHVDYWVL